MARWVLLLPRRLRDVGARHLPAEACKVSQRCGASQGLQPLEVTEPPTFGAFPSFLPSGFLPYRLLEGLDVSPDTRLLRYALPGGVESLEALGVPAGVKVRKEILGQLLDKSYSPVSHPAAKGFVELLVKRYSLRPGGGLGAFLCNMKPGEDVEMKLKAPRNLDGAPYSANRFKDVALVGAGTGVAPLLQMARVIMADPAERTRVWFIASHRTEKDALMLEELQDFEKGDPQRFHLHVTLSQPANAAAWREATGGGVGRVDLACLQEHCPQPSPGLLLLVCGPDGFLEHVCGGHVRVPDSGGGPPRKMQGPVRGLLAQLGIGVAPMTGAVVKL